MTDTGAAHDGGPSWLNSGIKTVSIRFKKGPA